MNKSEYKLFVILLVPIFLQTILQGLMGNIDTYLISHYSNYAVAAVGYSDKILKVIQRLFGIVSAGTVIIIPQQLGAKKKQEANDSSISIILFAVVFGNAISMILFFESKNILEILNIPNELYGDALMYFRIVSASLGFFAIMLVATSVLRCYNMASIGLMVSIIVNIFNLIGDYICVYYPEIIPVSVIAGIALMTFVSQMLGAIILIIFVYVKIRIVHINFSVYKVLTVLKIGFPAVGESFSYTLSQLVLTILITDLGTMILTANIYSMNIMMLISRLSYCIGTVTGIIVGENVGAKKFKCARKVCQLNVKLAILSNFIIGFFPVVFSKKLIGFFTHDEQIVKVAQIIMIFEFITLIFKSCNFVFGEALRGSGDVVFPSIIGIIFMWTISVAGTFFVGKMYGICGIYVMFLFDESMRALVLGLRWRGNKWSNKTIILGKN